MRFRVNVDKAAAILAGKSKWGLAVVDVPDDPVITLTSVRRKWLAKHVWESEPGDQVKADICLDVGAGSSYVAKSHYREVVPAIAEATIEAVLQTIDAFVEADRLHDEKEVAGFKVRRDAYRNGLAVGALRRNTENPPRYDLGKAAWLWTELNDEGQESWNGIVGTALYYVDSYSPSGMGYGEVSECQVWAKEDPLCIEIIRLVQIEVDRLNREVVPAEHATRVAARAALIAKAREKADADRVELERHRAEVARLDAKADTDRLDWIEKHGSDHLKRLVKENIKHGRVYRYERLNLERPGWVYDSDFAVVEAEPLNPPPAAIELLDSVRQLEPEAQLVFLPAARSKTWALSWPGCYVVRARCPWDYDEDIFFGLRGSSFVVPDTAFSAASDESEDEGEEESADDQDG